MVYIVPLLIVSAIYFIRENSEPLSLYVIDSVGTGCGQLMGEDRRNIPAHDRSHFQGAIRSTDCNFTLRSPHLSHFSPNTLLSPSLGAGLTSPINPYPFFSRTNYLACELDDASATAPQSRMLTPLFLRYVWLLNTSQNSPDFHLNRYLPFQE